MQITTHRNAHSHKVAQPSFFPPVKWMTKVFLLFNIIGAEARSSSLKLLNFGDAYTLLPNSRGQGGFAGIQTLITEERKASLAKKEKCILSVTGDVLAPNVISMFDFGAHRIELLNSMLSYEGSEDLSLLGNHEFDFGVPELTKRIHEESKFPWLGANVLLQDNSFFSGSTQTKIVEFDGFKVGFFGLITLETPAVSKTDSSIRFTPIVSTAKEMIRELKEQDADVIVCLSHLKPDEEEALRRACPEIKIQFGGHTHESHVDEDERSLLIRTGQNAERLARVILTLNQEDDSDEITSSISWDFIENKHVSPDPLMLTQIERIQKSMDRFEKEVIGTMGMSCDSISTNLRSKETAFGNFMADALLDRFNTDISLICGGSIRGNKYFTPGMPFTIKDVLDEHPYGHTVVTMEVSGQSILEAIEHSVIEVPEKTGRFPHIGGMQFSYDEEKPPHHRVNARDVFIRGAPLNLDKTYTMTTLDFFVRGLEDFTMFMDSPMEVTPEHGLGIVEVVSDYVKKNPIIRSQVEGRVVAKNSKQHTEL